MTFAEAFSVDNHSARSWTVLPVDAPHDASHIRAAEKQTDPLFSSAFGSSDQTLDLSAEVEALQSLVVSPDPHKERSEGGDSQVWQVFTHEEPLQEGLRGRRRTFPQSSSCSLFLSEASAMLTHYTVVPTSPALRLFERARAEGSEDRQCICRCFLV